MDRSTSHPGRGGDDRGGIRRSLLRDAVFVRLLDNVLRGVYRRGQRIRLDTIADDMRVSRTPVREALAPLEALRLVTVQRYVGVVITNWTVEHMTERIRIARTMLTEPSAGTESSIDRFDPAWLRECVTEGGAFVELGSWWLRRHGAAVSADWLMSQHALLDAFFTDDVALANGIDAVVARRERMQIVDRAVAAAEADALDECAVALVELASALIAMPDRFRSAA
ncbi:GntR family transcriptional regulator [Curtobacterium sp. MCPF17_002]|uniref:GntR family transcriptional regulator n=1 Tax=Curtobacterium sp. MCPF17_002 TaxID=2175645 RepID=UPI000DA8D024|nr:GntR family transcriptional regulator [Curtobacterium sp. MCPF17_002]WIB76802.1 GntR family transcriptional regulator [Curtobacterium sp. MCPF17_002]